MKQERAVNLRYIPEPYKSWTASQRDIVSCLYSHERNSRNVNQEITHIKKYIERTETAFPQYKSLLAKILSRPRAVETTKGEAGVIQLGRSFLGPMSSECRLSVLIPAKEEELTIYDTLASYAQQKDKNGNPLDTRLWEINVLVNMKEGEKFDLTYDEIMRFKQDFPHTRVNAVEVQFEKSWAKVGMARKLISDIILKRTLARGKDYKKPLYLQSDDADLIWVDPKLARTVIETLDTKNNLDAVVGYQEKFLRLIANVEFVFLSRRFWDIMTTQVFSHLLKGTVSPEQRDFHWSRPFTYGTNTAFTAEALALIGGYNWDGVIGEDLDIGKRISLLRGRNVNGTLIPNIDSVGLVKTRSNSSPRRYIWELAKTRGNAYSESNFQNGELRKVPLDQMIALVPERYRRLNESTKRYFEKELWFLYESLRQMMPNSELAKKIAHRTLMLIGFKSQDIEITNDEIHILNTENFSRALEEYRKRKGITV